LLDLQLFNRVFGSSKFPYAKISNDRLEPTALTRCVGIFGNPSSGKTMWMAKHIVDYAKEFPDRPVFSLDVKGSLTNEILKLVLREPPEVREQLISRLVLDAPGHSDYVLPTPEFSTDYGIPMEDQVQRVAKNLARLDPDLMTQTPIMGAIPIKDTGPNFFRLLTAIKNELGESWQITEAKRLIMDEGLRKRSVTKYGGNVPEAKWYFESFFDDLTASEQYRRSGTLVSVLGAVEPRTTRAKLGYFKPAWTPKGAIQKGQIVLIDGSGLANHEPSRNYLFMQAYSLVKAEIDKRIPDDPRDKPVSLVMDEVVSILGIPSMAPEIASIPSQNRSRKLQLYVALQELQQVSKELRPHLWSFGNIVCFAMTNFDEAYELAQQLFPYIPETVKLPSKTDSQQPITEVHSGQYTLLANQIQRLGHRHCLIRYYKNERDLDKFIHDVPRTSEVLNYPVDVWALRERLLRTYGVPLRDALKDINDRIKESGPTAPKVAPKIKKASSG
jgi:hypothetical protein